jgi:hypothetical protein
MYCIALGVAVAGIGACWARTRAGVSGAYSHLFGHIWGTSPPSDQGILNGDATFESGEAREPLRSRQGGWEDGASDMG